LNDDQARLLGTLDQVKAFASLDSALNLTALSGSRIGVPDDGQEQVQAFLYAMMAPTLTAMVAGGIALALQAQERAQLELQQAQDTVEETPAPLLQFGIALFPYLNATMIFLSTAWPMQQHLMKHFIEPIFQAMNQAEDYLKGTVRQLGPFVDKTIDGIQKDFHTVLEPLQPTLQQVQQKAQLLEAMKEGVDIPDPSDIDRELDEAQGIVSHKMKEAERHLEYEDYVPDYLDSPPQFYWRIVMPILVVAWLFQMGVAYVHEQSTAAVVVVVEETVHIDASKKEPRFLVGPFEQEDHFDFWKDTDELQPYQDQAQNSMNSFQDNTTDQLHDYEDQAKDQYNDYKDQATDQYNDYKDQANQLRQNMTNQYHQYKTQANQTFQNITQQLQHEIDEQIIELQSSKMSFGLI
jgi:hypothetical protein